MCSIAELAALKGLTNSKREPILLNSLLTTFSKDSGYQIKKALVMMEIEFECDQSINLGIHAV